MKRDILIRMRIISKEWQIKYQEDIIKRITVQVEDAAVEIGLLDAELSPEGVSAHFSLVRLLAEIDEQNTFISGFKQELEKLHTRLDDLTGGAKR